MENFDTNVLFTAILISHCFIKEKTLLQDFLTLIRDKAGSYAFEKLVRLDDITYLHEWIYENLTINRLYMTVTFLFCPNISAILSFFCLHKINRSRARFENCFIHIEAKFDKM